MPVFTSSIEVTADYPTIKPSLNLNFARSRSLDPRITFTRASTATYIGRDGLVRYAGVDEARFDHDPETLESLGLLIEESRTNIITQSGDISQFSQVDPNNQTLTANAAVAPDGTTTATRFTTNTPTGGNLQWISKGAGGSYSNVTVTGSFWARGDTTKTIAAHISDSIAGTTYTYTVTTEWQRFSFTKTMNTGAGVAALYPVFISNEPAGLNIYLWGAQLEVGAFPTSYIPTSGSAVTRAKDVAKITGTNFTNFYNTSEGTLYSSFIRNLQINGFLVGLGYDSNNYIGMGYSADVGNNDVYIQPLVGSIFGHPSVGGNVKVKSIVSYSSSGASSCINGNTVVSETASGGLPSGSNGALYIGTSAYDPPTIGTGLISSVVYYPQRLTDAQLQLLTS